MAQDRYGERPPLVVSPDLSAPWVMQLQRAPHGAPIRERTVRAAGRARRPHGRRAGADHPPALGRRRARSGSHGCDGACRAARCRAADGPDLPAAGGRLYRPHKPGTIVIDTSAKFLYLVQEGGTARRYGVGVGKEGFSWRGTETITRKAEWPGWTPPAEMIARERAKGRILPAHMPGGPENPLGARALYLGSTLYRIHGTNAPWTIGQAVSSGCIRMRNEDVTDLYERVKVGTRVVVS